MRIIQNTRIFKSDQEFPLQVRYQIQEFTYLHSHQFTEIVIVFSGKGIHETKFSKSTIRGGDVLVIPKDGYHGYSETESLEVINLLFDPEKIPVPLVDLYKLPGFNALFSIKNAYFNKNQPYPQFHLNKHDFEKIKWLLSDMKGENQEMIPGYRCCLMGYFMVILGKLSRLYTEDLSEIHEPSFKIGQAISFIKSNYSQDIKLEDIWQKIGMSRSTFMRQFHKAIGTTPKNYLQQIRINEACRLLRESDCNISEIAYKVGFNDSNYFTRQFYKTIGVTPNKFRKKQI